MKVVAISLFPEMFQAVTQSGITRRAIESGLVKFECINPRDYATDKHRTVDDRPFGGGPGMVMKVEPLLAALNEAKKRINTPRENICVIYLSPQGRVLNREGVKLLSKKVCDQEQHLVLIAGRYEGVDERLIENEVDEEWSIGDYVLSGGELPAMVMLDAIIRRLPGALGDAQSAEQDSFEAGLLDCPHYTRPEDLLGQKVPQVLLSGDHKRIERWREQQALGRTAERRPDLFKTLTLTEAQQKLLNQYLNGQDTEI